MSGTLIVDAVGPGATVQDGGRHGWLRYGVTPAGPMDWVAFETANLALGNRADAAALEIALGGLSLRATMPVSLAFAGGGFAWTLGETRLPSAARVTLRPGDVLSCRAGSWGSFAVCAVGGGIDTAPVMGSRATHVRSGLGGLEGRILGPGDRLPIAGGAILDDAAIDAPWLARRDTPVRVILGPQDDHFATATIDAFLSATYMLTTMADRMAYRFDGPPIRHAKDFNILSDGVALGAIQVAGDGLPLVLMADRQPTGGYAKIAHVCRADIGRLAQTRPGETVRFAPIDADAARTALLGLRDGIATAPARLTPLRLVPTAETLLLTNLIGGVADAFEDWL